MSAADHIPDPNKAADAALTSEPAQLVADHTLMIGEGYALQWFSEPSLAVITDNGRQLAAFGITGDDFRGFWGLLAALQKQDPARAQERLLGWIDGLRIGARITIVVGGAGEGNA